MQEYPLILTLPQPHQGVLVQRIDVVLYDGRLTGVALTVKFTESQRRLNSIKLKALKYPSYLDMKGLRGISFFTSTSRGHRCDTM